MNSLRFIVHLRPMRRSGWGPDHDISGLSAVTTPACACRWRRHPGNAHGPLD